MSAFREICRFEIAQRLRRWTTWIYAVVFAALACLAMTYFVSNTRHQVFDTPLAIAGATILATMLGLLVSAALAADAATGDAQARIEPLLHTTPLSSAAYVSGKFAAAVTVNAMLLAAVPLGAAIATVLHNSRGRDASFRLAAYLGAYLVFALPNAFMSTAVLFALARITRTAIASYLGALVLFLGAMVNEGLIAEAMGRWELATLLDPFGIVMVRERVRSWTPAEKDTLLVTLQGTAFFNRILWLGVGAAALVVAHARATSVGLGWRRRRSEVTPLGVPAKALSVPDVRRRFGLATSLRQTREIAWRSFRDVVNSWAVLLLAFPAFFMFLVAPDFLVYLGTPIRPTTQFVISFFINSGDVFLRVSAPFLIVVYAGELVWRERDARLSDIADAAPMADWVPFAGKFLGLALLLVVLQALMLVGAVLMQSGAGHEGFEFGLYLRVLFGFQLTEHLLFVVLALVIHVAMDHKYLAHLVVLLAYAFTEFASDLGIEQNLLVYASDGHWRYSDLRGFGASLEPLLWLKFYWVSWALLLAVLAKLLWVRGRERSLEARLWTARERITRATRLVAATAIIGIAVVGAFIFYNTDVVNAGTPAATEAELRAEYERRYSRHRDAAQPQLAAINLRVDIHPELRRADVAGTYALVNETGVPIDAIHVASSPRSSVHTLELDTKTTDVVHDRQFGHSIYTLAQPLAPGASLSLRFKVQIGTPGFPDVRDAVPVVENGTYISNEWLPAIGYDARRELPNGEERSAQSLPPRPLMRSVDDVRARHDMAGAERIPFEAVVSTAEGQTALAPGALRGTWTTHGRRFFRYVTDNPIRNDYALFSAAYAVRTATWRDVSIEVYHHPGHTWNVDRVLRSAQASLEYLVRHFGPYPHRQLRFVEHAGNGNSLHSAPINISYEEGFSLLNPEELEPAYDIPFAVVAHEVAHQWWGNQLRPAFVEGGAFLSESVAWYSAFGVVEQTHGRAHLERLLRTMRSAYLTPRARTAAPLLRAHDWFQAYRKGAFAMQAVREYVGEEQVNTALRRLLEKYGEGKPPLPTSRDLYAELQRVTPQELHRLLMDLFEVNTYWELSGKQASVHPLAAGEWDVQFDIEARKVSVNEEGVETSLTMDDLIEVGVFGEDSVQLYLQRHRIRSGAQRLRVIVPARPVSAGIDPRHLLIDLSGDDNVVFIR